MKTKPIILSLSLLLLSGTALADDDCDDPVASWQPRENLREKLEAEGWTVHRIKVDDGCREDSDGEERDRGNRKNGQDNPKSQAPRNGIVKGRPTVTVE
jgi:hypothetical protein